MERIMRLFIPPTSRTCQFQLPSLDRVASAYLSLEDENSFIGLIWSMAQQFASTLFTEDQRMVSHALLLIIAIHLPRINLFSGFERFAISPVNEQMAFVGNQGHVIITDPRTHHEANVVKAASAVNDLAFMPGGNHLITVGKVQSTRIIIQGFPL